MSVEMTRLFAGPHNLNSARLVDASASSVFSSPICRLKQPPFTLLVDGNNLTIHPNADDALQVQSYPPSSPERSAGFRALDGFSPYDTTQQRNTHIAVTGVVHYPWHPWRNRSVFIDDVIDRNGCVYFRCHVEETVHLRGLEIPDWMLQETCSTTGLVETPVVNCSALRGVPPAKRWQFVYDR